MPALSAAEPTRGTRRKGDASRATRDFDEKTLQRGVVDSARALGFLVYHTFDSRRSEPGFPDLCLARKGVVAFVELKARGKKPTEAQERWLLLLSSAGCPVAVFWPEDYTQGRVEAWLRRLNAVAA